MNYAEPTLEPMPNVLELLANYVSQLTGVTSVARNARYAEDLPVAEEVLFESPQVTTAYEPDTLARDFRSLANKWREEIGAESSLTRITGNENYLGVIALGERAVPLILHEMKREPAPWFVALRVLTKQQRIGKEHAGNFRKMADDWIKWGKDNQYI